MNCEEYPYGCEDCNYCTEIHSQEPERGRGMRRYYDKLKDKKLKRIINNGGYSPNRGYLKNEYNPETNTWEQKDYIAYPRNSNKQRWIKKMTSHKIRKIRDVPGHNGYRKYVDYRWLMY